MSDLNVVGFHAQLLLPVQDIADEKQKENCRCGPDLVLVARFDKLSGISGPVYEVHRFPRLVANTTSMDPLIHAPRKRVGKGGGGWSKLAPHPQFR